MQAGVKTPDQLMTWFSSLPRVHQVSLECGAGQGELAQFLAGHFTKSYALDLLPLINSPIENLTPIKGDAGALPFEDESVDLIVSMQALHHFPLENHLAGARRVLRKGGIFAALCWGDLKLPGQIRAVYKNVFEAINPYWESERSWVQSGYDGLDFDGSSITLPPAAMVRQLNVDALDLTIAQWSATQKALAADVDIPDADLSKSKVEKNDLFQVSWPILGQVFRR